MRKRKPPNPFFLRTLVDTLRAVGKRAPPPRACMLCLVVEHNLGGTKMGLGRKVAKISVPFAPPCRSGCFLPGRCFHPLVKMSPAQQEQQARNPEWSNSVEKRFILCLYRQSSQFVVVSCSYLLSPLLCFFPFFLDKASAKAFRCC